MASVFGMALIVRVDGKLEQQSLVVTSLEYMVTLTTIQQ